MARIRNSGCALAAAVVLTMLLMASVAQAALVTVGSPLTATFGSVMTGGNPGQNLTFANVTLPEPGANVTSPVFGTVVNWRISGAIGGPFYLRVLHPAGGGQYTGAGRSGPGAPSNMGLQSFQANLPIQAGDLIGLDDTTDTDFIGTANTGATFAAWFPALADGSTRSPNVTGLPTEIAFNADVRPVSNDINFGKVTKNKNRGTARLVVQVPDPGSLLLSGQGLKNFTAEATAPGDVTLRVKPKGRTKRKLNEDGKQKVKAKVTFSPAGIVAATERKPLTLRKRF